MPWLIVFLVIMIVAMAVGIAMMGGAQQPKTQDKIMSIPTTEIGVPIAVLFGTRIIKSPRIVWWGALKIVKIKVNIAGKK
jgi:hypothetical protein